MENPDYKRNVAADPSIRPPPAGSWERLAAQASVTSRPLWWFWYGSRTRDSQFHSLVLYPLS